MNNLIIFSLSAAIAMLFIFGHCNSSTAKCSSHNDCVKHIFYSDLRTDRKIHQIQKIQPSSAEDSITSIVMESLLECYSDDFQLRNDTLIRNERLYKFALQDSMNVYNFVFISLKRALADTIEPFKGVASMILNDAAFFEQEDPYRGGEEFIIPLNKN